MKNKFPLILLWCICLSAALYSCDPVEVDPDTIDKTLSGTFQYSGNFNILVQGEISTDTGIRVIDINKDSTVLATIEFMVDSAVLTIPGFHVSEKLVYQGDGLYRYVSPTNPRWYYQKYITVQDHYVDYYESTMSPSLSNIETFKGTLLE